LRKTKDAVGGADAFEEVIDDVNLVSKAAGKGYEQGTKQNFNISSFAGTQEGFMSDHCQIETLGIDELEKRCRIWCEANIPDFSGKTEEEKSEFCYLARGFCFQHKADNVAKAGKESFKQFRIKSGLMTAKSKRDLALASGVTFCWCAHKCVGMPNSSATELNLHYDFKIWLKKKGMEKELTVLQALGPLVGDRFWAVYKNAAMIYYLRKPIIDFMADRAYVSRGMGKPENNLAATIRSMSCLTLKEEQREQNQNFVLAEIRTMALWQFAVMNPLLLASFCRTVISRSCTAG